MTVSARSHMIAWRNRGAMMDFRGRHVFHVRGPGRRAADARRPTILCVHGYPTSSWDWTKVWPALVADYDVIAADMLGFGFSRSPPPRLQHVRTSRSAGSGAGAQRLREFHLLCHDYGDTVGQELLAPTRGHAARPASVVFLNGGLMRSASRSAAAAPAGDADRAVGRLVREPAHVRAVHAADLRPGLAAVTDRGIHLWALASRDSARSRCRS